MTAVVWVAAAMLLVVIGMLRAGGACLVRTRRADAIRDAAGGNARAAIVADLLEDRPRLQPALGMTLTTLIVVTAVPAVWALARSFSGWALLAALVVLSAVLILAGDLVPRSLGRHSPRSLAYAMAGLLRAAIAVGDAAADLLSDLDEEDEEPGPSEAQAKQLELISSVLDFSDTIVREVMTPRTDMVVVSAGASTEEALDLVIEAGRSRIPVVREGSDEVLGVLYARDLLKMMDDKAAPVPARDIMRPAYFVPETKRVPELLREMQANQVHLAMVVDEFGGTAGLVTIEDLLEELVGEIVDEYDDEEPLVTELEDGELLVDGRLAVDDLGEILGRDLPEGDWDTVGGFVLSLAGRVPREGESFEYGQHVFVADRVQGRRVARVRLRVS